MYIIEAKIEDIINDFPIVDNWLETISKSILCDDIDKQSVKSVYTFILVKTKNDRVLEMKFDERFQFELSKVRINFNLQIGKNFVFANRLPKGIIPKSIVDSISELTKIKMLIETRSDNSGEIRKSIPDIEKYADFLEQLEEIGEMDDILPVSKNIEYDMDDILDKINSKGINSLTKGELNYLKSKSE